MSTTSDEPTQALLRGVELEGRLRTERGRIFITGMQALVRVALEQIRRDRRAGHRTGGYVSGYRGSPLGRFDMEMWREKRLLEEHGIVFRPAVNEDLAATAIWGAQYVGTFPGAKVEGVFGMWYGKGPGVDRSGDALRHAAAAGTSKLGGVLCLAGDDHGAKSSTVVNFSDPTLIAAGIPVLYPASVQELLDFGLHGIAMSRWSGCWVGMKVVTDVVESAATVEVGPEAPQIVLPEGPPADVHARAFEMPLSQEQRHYERRLPRALAYARANALNTLPFHAAGDRIGILAAGKAYQDVRAALDELGIDRERAGEIGLRLGKVGLVWPLDPTFVREFARGLDTVVVVEEKRALIENQLKAILYDDRDGPRPWIVGKFRGAPEWSEDRGEAVIPAVGETDPALVARVLRAHLAVKFPEFASNGAAGADAVAGAAERSAGSTEGSVAAPAAPAPTRMPTFCSGCPHNRSTKLPDGSRALAGIGCHTIAMFHDPMRTNTVSHMGAEGVMWLGQQPFTSERHVFTNMGDGTYFHSGFLAIRQAVAARVPITYKLLVNGFVSMTGGQPIEGELTVPRTIAELRAEGVRHIVVVTEDVERVRALGVPQDVPVHDRSELDAVQRRLREIPDVSVLIYDQACATERRRLRKRGKLPDPDRRTYINAAVCEGCGDCSRVSGCLSIEPLETPLGRKRRINQSSCNKDYSCTEGFCPSFVTVAGAKLRRPGGAGPGASGTAAALEPPPVPPPAPASLDERGCNIVVAGIGGAGVVTLGQMIAVAAAADGLHSSVLDVTGLSQKYGAVLSHVRLARDAGHLTASRIAPASADVLLAADLLVAASDEVTSRLCARRTRAVVATGVVPTAGFLKDPDWRLDEQALLARLRALLGEQIATAPLAELGARIAGDAIAANAMLLGMGWQLRLVPVSHAALMHAIEVNGVQVEFNRRAFEWGRALAHDHAAVEARLPNASAAAPPPAAEPLDAAIARRVQWLTDWQDARTAQRYADLVARVRAVDPAPGGEPRLTRTVAEQLARVTAYKDEFEVARLHASPEFRAELEATFEPGYRLSYAFAGGPFAKPAADGTLRKREVGPWIGPVLRGLAAARGLRGTWLDPFRRSAERRLALELRDAYLQDVETLISAPLGERYDAALALASWPEKVRGYGRVREAGARPALASRAALREDLAGR